MDKKINILIYPAGGENALEVKEALSYKVNITVCGASSKKDHASFAYKNFSYGPNVNEKDFLDKFNTLLHKLKIDYIIPTHDTVVLKLSEVSNELASQLIASDYETNRTCRHKKLIFERFKSEKFSPKLYGDSSEVGEFPCFLKPDIGEGSKDSYVVENEGELLFLLKKHANREMVIMEYLQGKEFTVDCLTDRIGNLRYVGPRLRQRVFGGISANAITLSGDRFMEIAQKINSKLKFRGYWYFQVKEDKEGNLKLMEISARPAGTMSLYRQRGINFMLLSLYDFMGYDYEIIDNGYQAELDRFLFSRYQLDLTYDSIYMDFDDTLIFDGRSNKYCLLLLYQAKEHGLPVILLTKHVKNISETLRNFGISEQLFCRINQLGAEEDKRKYITHKHPIFIDNSFSERMEIHNAFNIPVFDTDTVPSLISWKE